MKKASEGILMRHQISPTRFIRIYWQYFLPHLSLSPSKVVSDAFDDAESVDHAKPHTTLCHILPALTCNLRFFLSCHVLGLLTF